MRSLALLASVLLLSVCLAAAAAESPESFMTRHYTDPALLGVPGPSDASAIALMPSSGGHIPTGVSQGAYALPPDISGEHWTTEGPKDALEAGLLGPAGDGKFHPSRLCTNQELTNAMQRLLGRAAAARPECVRVPLVPALPAMAPASPDLGQPAARADLARALAGLLCNFAPAADELADAMRKATEIYYDVPSGSPRFAVTVGIRDIGLVRGLYDGGYHPDEPFTRAELAESLVWTWSMLRGMPTPKAPPARPAPTLESVGEPAGTGSV